MPRQVEAEWVPVPSAGVGGSEVCRMHVATGGPVARRIEVPRRLRVYRAALSPSGAVARGLGLQHQRQLCVGGDIADMSTAC